MGSIPLLPGFPSEQAPELRIAWTAYSAILCDLCSRRPEAGGLLLGPLGSPVVTDFHFDASGDCSGVSYSPDHVTLRRLMQEEWLPRGIDMKGFVHSHPPGYERLSPGDLRYVQRLLRSNEDMSVFLVPLVLPDQFRLIPWAVLRSVPNSPQIARIVLF